MEISHFLQAGENPHIAFLAFDAYAGLIDMQQAPAAEASHDLVVGAFVDLRRRSLEFVCRLPRDVFASCRRTLSPTRRHSRAGAGRPGT